MDRQGSRCSRLAVKLGKEARAALAACKESACLAHEVFQFRMLVRPAAGADVGPQGSFIGPEHADADMARRGWLVFDGQVEDVADLNGLVASLAKEAERRWPNERANL